MNYRIGAFNLSLNISFHGINELFSFTLLFPPGMPETVLNSISLARDQLYTLTMYCATYSTEKKWGVFY